MKVPDNKLSGVLTDADGDLALACDLEVELAGAAGVHPDVQSILPPGIYIGILEAGDA